MTALSASVDTRPDAARVDLLDTLDLSSLVRPSFPSPELVSAACSMLTPFPKWRGQEGPRRRLEISAGTLRVSSRDAAKAERAYEREVGARVARANLTAQEILRDGAPTERESTPIRVWSSRSRGRMIERLAQLDYQPFFAQEGTAAMVTLTYPGEWLSVAPDAAAVQRHLRLFRLRFERAWGRKLLAVWKREFQRRGAPHVHLFMVPPRGRVNGQGFGAWLASTWVSIVAHEDPQVRADMLAVHLHPKTVDYGEGLRATDPKRLAVYFTKHGAYAAKEYQNQPPLEWLTDGKGIGRFWGYWNLAPVVGVVEVSHVEAYAAARTLRRWSRANGYVAKQEVWRAVTAVDVETGEIVPVRWRRRRVNRRTLRMKGHLGFVTVNDGPAVVSQLVRYLDQVRERAQLQEMRALGYTGSE